MHTWPITEKLFRIYLQTIDWLNFWGEMIPAMLLRLILAVEFGESGFEKLHGSNWFHNVTFPFPFNLLPTDVSWSTATYFEIIGAIALLLGLATRFFSISLIVLTIVAILSVHWPSQLNSITDLIAGYRILDEEGDGLGNYKLPLIYIVMFLPLVFKGAGKFSLDYLILIKNPNNHGE